MVFLIQKNHIIALSEVTGSKTEFVSLFFQDFLKAALNTCHFEQVREIYCVDFKDSSSSVIIQSYLTRHLIMLSFRAAARNLERLLMRPKPKIPRVARNDKVR